MAKWCKILPFQILIFISRDYKAQTEGRRQPYDCPNYQNDIQPRTGGFDTPAMLRIKTIAVVACTQDYIELSCIITQSMVYTRTCNAPPDYSIITCSLYKAFFLSILVLVDAH